MPNMPGPYEIEFDLVGFTSPVRAHKIRLNCAILGNPAPGTLPTAITVQKAGGATAAANVVVDQAWSFLRQFWPNTINCSGYQIWKYITGTYGKNFISAGAVTTPLGTGSGITVAHQTTLTFRSANGGIMKSVFLETMNTGNTQVALVPNGAGNVNQKWAAYVLSADNFWLAADDAYPVTALRVSLGENERIFRKVFRGV